MFVAANNFTFVFWIAVIPAFLSFAVIMFFVHDPERPAGVGVVKSPLRPAELRRLGGAYWLVVSIAALFTLARFSEAFLLLRAQSVGLTLALVPAVLVAMNVVYAASAWPAGVLSDKFGRFGVLAAGFGMLLVADVVLALAGNIGAVVIGAALWGLHMGLTQGLLAAMVADTAPLELRGTAFGMFNLITGLTLLLASVIAGALWDTTGPQGTFLVGALLTAAALAALPLLRRRLIA
jgi:MFS family permease